jgi:hypothetical protein
MLVLSALRALMKSSAVMTLERGKDLDPVISRTIDRMCCSEMDLGAALIRRIVAALGMATVPAEAGVDSLFAAAMASFMLFL